jgi:hypothetical protein
MAVTPAHQTPYLTGEFGEQDLLPYAPTLSRALKIQSWLSIDLTVLDSLHFFNKRKFTKSLIDPQKFIEPEDFPCGRQFHSKYKRYESTKNHSLGLGCIRCKANILHCPAKETSVYGL